MKTLKLKANEEIPDNMDRCKRMAKDIDHAQYRHSERPQESPSAAAIMDKVMNTTYEASYPDISDPVTRKQCEDAENEWLKVMRDARNTKVRDLTRVFYGQYSTGIE